MLKILASHAKVVAAAIALLLAGALLPTPANAVDVTADISGIVIDNNGDPVSIPVTLDVLQSGTTYQVVSEQTTDVDGSFTFTNVAVGSYQISTKPSPVPNLTVAGRKAIMHSDPFTIDDTGAVLDQNQLPLESISITQINVPEIPVEVVDGDSNPVSGIALKIFRSETCDETNPLPSPNATASTKTQGTATFYAPESGSYCLKITDPTGLTVSTSDLFTVTIPADGTDVLSTAGGPYTLSPAGNVQVKAVAATTGKAIAGAVVTGVYDDGDVSVTVSATTNSSGIALLKGLPDGVGVTITVAGPPGSAYVDNSTSAIAISGQTVLCDPPSNGDTEGVVPLDIGYPISGTVRDSSGKPLKDIKVDVQSVDDAGEETPVTILTTNALGVYTTNGLLDGSYNIHFSDISADQGQYRENVDLLDLVVASKALPNQNVVMRDCGVISGTAFGESGFLTTATVYLRDAYGLDVQPQQEVDGDTGDFKFTKVLPGKYTVRITSPGFRDKFINNVVVTAKNDNSLAQSETTLASGSGITGTIVDSNAVPVINARVEIYSAASNGFLPIATTSTNSDGGYGFTNLPVSTYRIKVVSEIDTVPSFDDYWYLNETTNAPDFDTAADLATELGVITNNVNPAPVTPWASVTGTINNGVDADGLDVALEGATISLVDLAGNKVESALTDSTGSFTLFAPTGNYRLLIEASGFTDTYLSLDSEGSGVTTVIRGDALLITFAQGLVSFTGTDPVATATLPIVDVSSGGGTLSVSVFDQTDPVIDGVVTVFDVSGNQVAWVDFADDNNLFVIKGLAKGLSSGTYRVSYSLEGQYSTTYYGGTTSLNASGTKSIVISSGKTTSIRINAVPLPSIDLELKSTGTVGYTKEVTVEVYEIISGQWTLNTTLTTQGAINATTKVMNVKVSAGSQYRIRIVPDDPRVAAVWLGTKPDALNVDQASTITMPSSGSLAKQTVLLNAPSININAILTNSFEVDGEATDIRQVMVTLTGKIDGEDVTLESNTIATIGAGETVTSLFDHVRTAYFPLTITATSVDAVADAATVTSLDLADANVAHPNYIDKELSFSAAPVLATLSGTLSDTDGSPVASTAVNLLTVDGAVAFTETTDEAGAFSFVDLPLGVHFTLETENDSAYLKTSDNGGKLDFVAQSGDQLTIDLELHVAAMYSGTAYDPGLNPLPGAQINIWKLPESGIFNDTAKPSFVVYAIEDGTWVFDGRENDADVGDYIFQVDGNDSSSLPAYFVSACDEPDLSCSSTSSSDAQPISTTADSPAVDLIMLVLQEPDLTAPTGVKWASQPLLLSVGAPTWKWTGSDETDGKDLQSQYVLSTTAGNATKVGAWSALVSQSATMFSIAKPVAGTTYCLSIRMVDQSNNASAFTAPSCTTVPIDDAKLTPVKKKDWVRAKAKDAYQGTLTASKKTVKAATLTTKGYAGSSICVLFAKDPKKGTFAISQGRAKKGGIINTAGSHKPVQFVCVAATVKTTDAINFTVIKPGTGVQIDGFAVAPKAPAKPTGY